MSRLHTHNRRHARLHGPHTKLEKRMASYEEGAAVVARVRARGFPERLCVGLACIDGRAGKPGLLQVVYRLQDGRYAFVMATGVTYSASKHARGRS